MRLLPKGNLDLRNYSKRFAAVLALSVIALMVSSSASAQKRPDQTETSPPTQMPVEGQPAAGEQAPAPTPNVVLDDTQPAPPPNPPNPDNPTETGPKTTRPAARTPKKTVELTDFQQMVVASLGKPLPIYGLSLFENVPTTFAPVDRVPVTADYVLGPGDELLIRAWGQIDLNVHTRIDRNGSIFVPKVGNLNVAGLKYSQVEEFLKSHIGRIYQNFDLNVSMGELRSIDVYVVGQARSPGRYTVSSLSTLANAIFASGGPSPTGSMRHIQLKRGAVVITDFDLYDLLLNGDKSKDVVLGEAYGVAGVVYLGCPSHEDDSRIAAALNLEDQAASGKLSVVRAPGRFQ